MTEWSCPAMTDTATNPQRTRRAVFAWVVAMLVSAHGAPVNSRPRTPAQNR